MQYEFKTEVDSNDYHIQEYTKLSAKLDTYKSKATIWWGADLEVRSWGIKSFDVKIISVSTKIEFEVYLEDLNIDDTEKLLAPNVSGEDDFRKFLSDVKSDGEKITGILDIYVDSDSSGWEIIEEFSCTKSGNLSPDECEIDFGKKTITIS
jgi:hypothetical protein